ncbi:MAG: hypothetical protein U0638_11790 [Phycisphaerales bacterium]
MPIRLLRWLFVVVLLHDMRVPEGQLVGALTNAEELTHARQSLTKTGLAPGLGIKVETVAKKGAETGEAALSNGGGGNQLAGETGALTAVIRGPTPKAHASEMSVRAYRGSRSEAATGLR